MDWWFRSRRSRTAPSSGCRHARAQVRNPPAARPALRGQTAAPHRGRLRGAEDLTRGFVSALPACKRATGSGPRPRPRRVQRAWADAKEIVHASLRTRGPDPARTVQCVQVAAHKEMVEDQHKLVDSLLLQLGEQVSADSHRGCSLGVQPLWPGQCGWPVGLIGAGGASTWRGRGVRPGEAPPQGPPSLEGASRLSLSAIAMSRM